MNLRSNTSEFSRFLLVGLVNTLVHFLVLSGAYEILSFPLVSATVLAFSVAVFISYLLNYRFTFHSQKQHKSSLPKFIITTLIGLGWNVGITVLVVEDFGGSVFLAVIMAAFVVMLNNYLLSKFWVFNDI